MWKPALENRQPASQYISTQWLDCEQSLFIFAWDSGRKRANCDCEFVVARLRAARTKGARLSLGLRPRSSRFEASPHAVSQLQIARFLPLSQRKITTSNRNSRFPPLQYGAQFPATKDGNMHFVPQKASNQLKLTLIVASVFKKQV